MIVSNMEIKKLVSYDIEKKPIYANETIVEVLDANNNIIEGFFKFNTELYRYELFILKGFNNSNLYYILKGNEKIKVIENKN